MSEPEGENKVVTPRELKEKKITFIYYTLLLFIIHLLNVYIFLENQSKAYLKMKKKREAKRQAKQLQEVYNISNSDKKLDEPIVNKKQLRIKKIQSVCLLIILVDIYVLK